jgi:hypothetical protein
MGIFRECFIGVPLPQNIRGGARRLPHVVSRHIPEFNPERSIPEAVRLYNLGNRTNSELVVVEWAISELKYELKRGEVTAGGYGFDDRMRPSVYLGVRCSESVEQFYRELQKEMDQRAKTKNPNFHPIVLLAENLPMGSLSLLRRLNNPIQRALTKISWRVPVNEIVIYGKEGSSCITHTKLSRVTV